MKIIPLGDNVLIKPEEREERTTSGIYLPQTVEGEKPQIGKVVAVGPGKKTEEGKYIPLSVKEGDRVIFTKYGPTEIKIEGEKYLIAKEEDILAIIED